MMMKRLLILLMAMLATSASEARGQTAIGQPLIGTVPSAEPLRGPVDSASLAALGWSGSLRVVLAEPGEMVEGSLLAALGDGWNRGHRWRLLHGPVLEAPPLGEPAPRVLGEPTVEPAPPEPPPAADSGNASLPPVASPEVLGAPAAPVPAASNDPARQSPAAPEAAAAAAAPAVLGEPAPRAIVAEELPFVDSPLQAATESGIVAPQDIGVWLLESGTGSAVTVITQVPASRQRNGRLNGYMIGTYPTQGSSRTDAYSPPLAFIEVTPTSRDLPISDHLTLGQFLTKDQFEVWPKYVALDLQLVDKIELVIDELNAMGIRAENVHVMSGFRTPRYNGPGGDGRAALSRHMWGDAADLWIDNDRDGQMDDLNGDGRIDLNDANVVLRAVERVERRYPELIGGAGTYPTTPTHGPYIHIDARGSWSRW